VHKLRFIAQKEFYHIMRDARSLAIVLVMPVLMTFLYGYAINMDIEHLKIGVVDHDHTQESRALIEQFYASTYFSPPDEPVDPNDPQRILQRAEANGVLVIRHGFGEDVRAHRHTTVGMIIDGADNNTAAALRGYADGILMAFLKSQFGGAGLPPNIEMSTEVLYNPDLKSSIFFVPGLVAVILMMVSALLTSITIAREKETGTMEQLLTAPVSAGQIIIGKILPYVVIALADGVLVLIFAKILFNVPFRGSGIVLLGFGMLYIITSLSIGILISSAVKTQQVAMMLALMSTMLPSIMLSGFIFALKNMPVVLQGLSHIVPARYFLVIIRGIMLKGASVTVLAQQSLYLALLTLILLTVAAKKFNTRVN